MSSPVKTNPSTIPRGAKVFDMTDGLSTPTTSYCPGCTHGVVQRLIGEVLEELGLLRSAVAVVGSGCNSMAAGYLGFSTVSSLHGKASAVATAIKRVRPEVTVITVQGDGDATAIGLAETLHAANRGENITQLVLNNRNYGMTGGQYSPMTFDGQHTSTTPQGRDLDATGGELPFAEIVSAIPGAVFVERVTVTTPKTVVRAKRAIRKGIVAQSFGRGFSMVELLETCPTYWHMTPVAASDWLDEQAEARGLVGELKNPLGITPTTPLRGREED